MLPWQEGSGRAGSKATSDQVSPPSLLRDQPLHLRSPRLRSVMYTDPSAVSTASHSSEASWLNLEPDFQVCPPSSLRKAMED